MNPDEQKVVDTAAELSFFSNSSLFESGRLKLETALLIDAVQMYHQALNDLDNVDVKSIDCSAGDYWEYGHSLINLIKTVSTFVPTILSYLVLI